MINEEDGKHPDYEMTNSDHDQVPRNGEDSFLPNTSANLRNENENLETKKVFNPRVLPNIIDPLEVNDCDAVEEVKDVVQTITNAVFCTVENNVDQLTNRSSNTLGMRVKDSLILKVQQSNKREIMFDRLGTSSASQMVVDDDQIQFSPVMEISLPSSESRNLSTKRKKSISLAEHVKIFNGSEEIERTSVANEFINIVDEFGNTQNDGVDFERLTLKDNDELYDRFNCQKSLMSTAESENLFPNKYLAAKTIENKSSIFLSHRPQVQSDDLRPSQNPHSKITEVQLKNAEIKNPDLSEPISVLEDLINSLDNLMSSPRASAEIMLIESEKKVPQNQSQKTLSQINRGSSKNIGVYSSRNEVVSVPSKNWNGDKISETGLQSVDSAAEKLENKQGTVSPEVQSKYLILNFDGRDTFSERSNGSMNLRRSEEQILGLSRIEESKSALVSANSIILQLVADTSNIGCKDEESVDLLKIPFIESTKSLETDVKENRNREKPGHKLLDDEDTPLAIGNIARKSYEASTQSNFIERQIENKTQDFGANCTEAYVSEHSMAGNNASTLLPRVMKSNENSDIKEKQLLLSMRDSEADNLQQERARNKKFEGNVRKFADSLSRIFSNSSRKKMEFNVAADSKASIRQGQFKVAVNLPLQSASDGFNDKGKEHGIKKEKSGVISEYKGEELVAVKSLEFAIGTDNCNTNKEIIRNSEESLEISKTGYTTSTSNEQPIDSNEKLNYAPIDKYDDRCTQDDQLTKSSKGSATGRGFSTIRKLFSKASIWNKKSHTDQVDQVEEETHDESSSYAMNLPIQGSKNASVEQRLPETGSTFSKGLKRLFRRQTSEDLNCRSSHSDTLSHRLGENNGTYVMMGYDIRASMNNNAKKEPHGAQFVIYNVDTTAGFSKAISKTAEPPGTKNKNQSNHTEISAEGTHEENNVASSSTEFIHDSENRVVRNKNSTRVDKPDHYRSEIAFNDPRPGPNFVGRRSTVVMMATPFQPEEKSQAESSSGSDNGRGKAASSPTALYYFLGPSLDEALVDVRILFQSLIDKVTGRGK